MRDLGQLESEQVEEVILATNPSVEGEAEGEAAALYLAKLLEPLGVRITRIAPRPARGRRPRARRRGDPVEGSGRPPRDGREMG
jgi:hypothetical protein